MEKRSYIEAISARARARPTPGGAGGPDGGSGPDGGRDAAPSADGRTDSGGPGSIVGDRYVLEGRIGSGRLGEIFRARDRASPGPGGGPDRSVAIQLVRSEAEHRYGPSMEHELASLQSLSHPNLVRVTGFGRDGGTCFAVMELLEGGSLRFILDDASPELLSKEEALAVIRAVGDALKYLHAKGMIHGAVGPETVFVTGDYAVKLVDLAPAVPDLDVRRPNRAHARDDVYGLACLAYELLSGKHPFNGNLPYEAERAGLVPDRIRGLPRVQWKALARGLAFRRKDRTPTVEAFLAELGVTGLEKLPVESTDDGPGGGRGGPVRGRRRISAIAGAVLLGLAAAAYFDRDGLRSLWPEPTAATEKRSPAGPNASGERADTTADAPPPAQDPAGLGGIAAPVPTSPVAAIDPAAAERAADAEAANSPANAPGRDEVAAAVGTDATEEPSPPARAEFGFVEPSTTVYEGDRIAVVAIQRFGDAKGQRTVLWWTTSGTATADDDYAYFERGRAVFADGERRRVLQIPLVDDGARESSESFYVHLAADPPPGAEPEVLAQAEVVIVDDD